MRLLSKLIGFGLLLTGLYFLGQNIYFTTNVYPYWWRGIAADFSILSLTLGIVLLFILPSRDKTIGWIIMAIGVLFVFLSSKAVLNPTSLWQFCLSLACFVGGYQMLTTGRINI